MRKSNKSIEYNPVCDPKNVHGYQQIRWVENVSCGLRRIGFADEIAREEGCRSMVDHKGWFTDDDGFHEVYRGVVYQLPSRDRVIQYVYGYDDPNNPDCALLCFVPETDKMEAAKAADHIAEVFAEKEREYQRVSQAGYRYRELADDVIGMRARILSICKEMKAARKLKANTPIICATLRENIGILYRGIQAIRKERADLLDQFGTCDGFTG